VYSIYILETLIMGRYDRNNRPRSNNRFNRPTMYDAVCDECGKDCKVPFRPSGDKPIYCSDCFERHDNNSSRRDGGRDSNRRDSGRKEMFHAVCDECGKDCEVPFRPSPDKPIYCSRCFDEVSPRRESSGNRNSNRGSSNENVSELKDQLGSISAKLDKLLKILTPIEVEIKEEKEVVVEKKAPVKKKVAAKKKVVKKKSTTKKKAAKKA
jgi:CxxC-x17-CxxC domain-containing protein